MIIENTEALKTYLISNLSKLCDADPGALTKYVLALLKKNRPETELREFLLDQLDVFLLKETAPFVDLLLQALKTKSYIENVPLSDADVTLMKKNDNSVPKNGMPDLNMLNKKSKSENDSKIKEYSEKTSQKVQKTKPEHTLPKIGQNQDSPPIFSDARAHSITPSMSRDGKYSSDICEKIIDVVDPQPKTFGIQIVDNADYRSEKLLVPETSSNYLKRCQDYDERGYCLKGSLCAYDHGCDPILVEDVSSLNFNVCPDNLPPFEDGSSHTTGTGSKSPLPPLPTTSPPPLPPLPPPPPSMLDPALGLHYIPEPYNPESPGMGTYYTPYCMPPLPPSTGPPGIVSSVYKSRNETFHSKPQRTRELIGVPTINSVVIREPNNSESTCEHPELKRKAKFDFSRLGPKKFARSGSVLELRNVPQHLNTISMLNSHFTKFGRIVNIEVAYDNDPEAALVKFGSPMEAANAYRSSVAIFNNRFVKVFYHNPPSTLKTVEKRENIEVAISEKLPEKPVESTPHTKYASTHIRKGNVSRTVFIPTSERVFQKSYPDHRFRDLKKDLKNPLEKKLELLRKKQGCLKCYIDHQKVVLEKLMKSKTKKEQDFLKTMIETISSKIITLKTEIKQESDDLKNKLASKQRSEKELLDAEMDLYRERKRIGSKSTETNDPAKLRLEADELKAKVRALGLIGGPSVPQSILGKSRKQALSTQSISRPRQVSASGEIKEEDLLKHSEHIGDGESSKMDAEAENPETVGDDEEEEEEDEDSEARSWRR